MADPLHTTNQFTAAFGTARNAPLGCSSHAGLPTRVLCRVSEPVVTPGANDVRTDRLPDLTDTGRTHTAQGGGRAGTFLPLRSAESTMAAACAKASC